LKTNKQTNISYIIASIYYAYPLQYPLPAFKKNLLQSNFFFTYNMLETKTE